MATLEARWLRRVATIAPGIAGLEFVVGTGEDSVMARAFAIRLSLLGFLAIHHFDPVLVPAEVSTSSPDDVLLLFSERGQAATLCQLARLFRSRQVVNDNAELLIFVTPRILEEGGSIY